MIPVHEKLTDKMVLLGISSGLILIIGGIIVGIFTTPRSLPNWAENVLVSIGTAGILKLGDCLNALVQLSTGRSVERLGNQLAAAAPVAGDAPQPVTVVNAPDAPVPVEPAP
jgi:hypothetical protein